MHPDSLADINQKNAVAVDVSVVQAMINRIFERVDLLALRNGELIARLDGVLVPVDTQTLDVAADYPNASLTASQLRRISDLLAREIERVENTIGRLEV